MVDDSIGKMKLRNCQARVEVEYGVALRVIQGSTGPDSIGL
jgi:hypothetical protein